MILQCSIQTIQSVCPKSAHVLCTIIKFQFRDYVVSQVHGSDTRINKMPVEIQFYCNLYFGIVNKRAISHNIHVL